MSDKRTVLNVLKRMAFASELLGRPQAMGYTRAARSLQSTGADLRALHARGELATLKGVGPKVAELVGQVLDGETPGALAEMEAQIPEGLFEVRRVPGLGPKRVRTLWRSLGITTLGELEYACNENRLLELKGFGAKTQAKVLAAVAHIRRTEGQIRRDQGLPVADALVARLAAEFGRAVTVGPWRRGCELVRQVDLLVTGEADAIAAALEGRVEDAVVRLRHDEVPVAVHACAADAFGTESVRLTASEGHLEALRAHAGGYLDRVLAEAHAEEDEVYAALGLHTPPAERREAHVPLAPLDGPAPPPLVTLDDLQGALHNHTVASDGLNTLEQMRDAAAALGLNYLGVSDHSRTAAYAGGLEIEDLEAQRREIEAMGEGGCVLLRGVESDILADGGLDYPPEVLDGLEFVVASVHNRFGQGFAEMTARMVAAARDPHTTLVGHPTGRLLLGRAPAEYDMEAFLDACAESGCAVELNASPHRLDLRAEHLEMAKERGIPVSIGADAHSTQALKNLRYGVTQARRAGLTPADVLNTRTLAELREWLATRGGAA